MAYNIDYEIRVSYLALPGLSPSPSVGFTLHLEAKRAKGVAVLDTGCLYTIFQRSNAELLGIEDITVGRRINMTSGGGTLSIYQFETPELEIHLGPLSPRFSGQICFADGIPRNILGLNLMFHNFQIGFRDSQRFIYFLRDNTTSHQ